MAIVAAEKPIMVFNMAFHNAQYSRPRRAVSGAGLFLASSLRQAGVARTFFMKKPLIVGCKPMPSRNKALIFAISLYDLHFEEIQKEVKAIRARYPKAFIIMGGPPVNATKNLRALASFFPEVTAFVKGDGEKPLVELTRILTGKTADQPFDAETKTELSGMQGVYIQHFDFVHWHERTKQLTDAEFESLPPMLYTLPALVKQIKEIGFLGLNTSRGCLYRCIFCGNNYHTEPIAWSAGRIVQELKRIKGFVEKGTLPPEAKTIVFNDDNFFRNAERAKEFLRLVAQDETLKEFFKFIFQGRVDSFYEGDNLDYELLDLLAEVEVEDVELGTDGFHPFSLGKLIKGYRWKLVEPLMEALEQRGIGQTHFAILTYWNISPAVLMETSRTIRQLLVRFPRTLRIKINTGLVAYEDTELAKLMIRKGIRLRRIYSETGEERILPTFVGVGDPKLARALNELWRQEVISSKDLRSAFQDLQKRLGRKKIVFRDLLRFMDGNLQFAALAFMESRLARLGG